MSLDLALGIARSGLAAVQRGLAQSSQNIGNAETPGYTRKTVPQHAASGAGLPAGVRTGEAQRAVDSALLARLEESRAGEAAAALRERLLSGVERAQGAPGDGTALTDALGALRGGLIGLRASPADAGLQRGALEAAETLARRLNETSDAIQRARQEAQDTIEGEVAAINATLREIAALTNRLKSGLEGDPAAIEDRRDAAVARLAESLEVRAVRQGSGDIVLIARGGMVLPLDPDSDVFSVAPATLSPQAFHGPGGTLPGVMLNGLDVTASLLGGRLGEAVALRDRTLPRLQAEADLAAAHIAARFEAQGLRLFTDTGGGVPATGAYAGSAQIGFAGRIAVNPAVAANPALLRDGTHAVPGFAPNPPGGPAGFATLLDRVLDFTFGADAAPGTPWPAVPVTGLGPDGSLASPFAAPPTIEGYVARLVSAQAADRAAATAARSEAGSLRTSLEARLRRESGVDVDAEMAGLVALQNAYAANARVVGTVQAMWDSLLAAMR
ncbi:flagellar hook-associated protein FlgK [Crenalkalicoccus roseus]|uniref:flagellar hook-associated protein FlgK n=1 Tax=Crenalkalicoccus roseus TaxID=1485588 RepID=UPI001081B7CE|nr:flagellar basal body rod C-terminal domain-containing protein [Crenalkalicoccus roseus]